MLRKISVITFMLLSLSTTAWSSNNRFYLGAGIGPETANFKENASVIQPGSFNVKNTSQQSGTGVFGTLFGGYGFNYQQFYMAGELNANTSTVESTAANDEYVHSSFSQTSFKMQNGYGLSVLPGYLFTPATLFYARLGYIYTNIRVRTTDTSLADIDKNLSGLRIGLGMSQEIAQHLSVRMEYSQVRYQDTIFTTFDPLSSTTKKTNITPETGQVEFGIVYNFC